MSERKRTELTPCVARGLRELLDETLGDFRCGGEPMGVLKLTQRLLGGGPLFPVRLDGVAEFGERRLGGKS